MKPILSVLAALGLCTIVCYQASAAIIYSTTGDGTALATIDTSTGAGSVVGPSGYSQDWAAAFDTDGTLFTTINGLGNAQLAVFNKTTGAATPVGSPMGVSMICLEVDSSGNMYGVGYDNGNLYSINKTTGVVTPIGPTGISMMMDLAFSSSGTLYGTVSNYLWTINTASGVATFQSTMTGGPLSAMGIMFDAADTLYATDYVSNSRLYQVDPTTGVTSLVGVSGLNYPHGGDIYTGGAVPETGNSLLLLGGALASLALLKRKLA